MTQTRLCERVSVWNVGPAQIYKRYLQGNRPVIITDVLPRDLTPEKLTQEWGADTRVLASYSPDRWFLRPEVNPNGELVVRESAFLNTTLGQFMRLIKSG